jgi:hypothetical protein
MSKVTKGTFGIDEDQTIRTSSMRLNVRALQDRGIEVNHMTDDDGDLVNVYVVFEMSNAINTNPLYEQLVDAGLTPSQANEIVEVMLKAANTRLMYNAIEETQHLQ